MKRVRDFETDPSSQEDSLNQNQNTKELSASLVPSSSASESSSCFKRPTVEEYDMLLCFIVFYCVIVLLRCCVSCSLQVVHSCTAQPALHAVRPERQFAVRAKRRHRFHKSVAE